MAHKMIKNFSIISALIFSLSGCTTAGVFDGLTAKKPELTPSEKTLASDLIAFCPQVFVKEGTSSVTKYEKGGENDPNRVIYQGSIVEVTRNCARADGMVKMTIGVNGKVVPGQKAMGDPVSLPIEIVIMSGDKVLYSQTHHSKVAVVAGQPATQFVLSDPNPMISEAEINAVQIVAGFKSGAQPEKTAQ